MADYTPGHLRRSGLLGKVAQNILVVEDDEGIGSYIGEILEQMGVSNAMVVADGATAWEEAQKVKYDFIVLDWKLPEISGLALMNRFRQHRRYQMAPILVVSGFVKKRDFSLLEDFILTDIIEKPFQAAMLVRSIEKLHEEALWLRNQRATIETIFRSMKSDTSRALSLLNTTIKKAGYPVPLAVTIARMLISVKMFAEAEDLLKGVQAKSPNSPILLNELGKLYLLMNRFDEAKKILLEVHRRSPDNLDRLCVLGNISLREMNPADAKLKFDSALQLDASNPRAKNGRTLAVNMEEFLGQGKLESVPGSFASLQNAIAIAMVKSGRFVEGMEHYRSALSYVHDGESIAKISFNLGLGYMRWRKPDLALTWFSKAVSQTPDYERAKKYVDKLGGTGKVVSKVSEEDAFALAEAEAIFSELGVDRFDSGEFDEEFEFESMSARVPLASRDDNGFSDIEFPGEQSQQSPMGEKEERYRRMLLQDFPLIEEIFQLAKDKNHDLAPLYERYYKIYERFGAKDFKVALKAAIKQGLCLPNEIQKCIGGDKLVG